MLEQLESIVGYAVVATQTVTRQANDIASLVYGSNNHSPRELTQDRFERIVEGALLGGYVETRIAGISIGYVPVLDYISTIRKEDLNKCFSTVLRITDGCSVLLVNVRLLEAFVEAIIQCKPHIEKDATVHFNAKGVYEAIEKLEKFEARAMLNPARYAQIKEGISAEVANTFIKNEMEHYLGYGAAGYPDVDVCKRGLEEIKDIIAPGRHRVEMTMVYQSILTRCLSLFESRLRDQRKPLSITGNNWMEREKEKCDFIINSCSISMVINIILNALSREEKNKYHTAYTALTASEKGTIMTRYTDLKKYVEFYNFKVKKFVNYSTSALDDVKASIVIVEEESDEELERGVRGHEGKGQNLGQQAQQDTFEHLCEQSKYNKTFALLLSGVSVSQEACKNAWIHQNCNHGVLLFLTALTGISIREIDKYNQKHSQLHKLIEELQGMERSK